MGHHSRLCISCSYPLVFLLSDCVYPVHTVWFSCSQIVYILFRPFGFLVHRLCISCSEPLVFLLPNCVYPVHTLWFSCSQIVYILFRPFRFLAPRLCISCSFPLVFLLPKTFKYFFLNSLALSLSAEGYLKSACLFCINMVLLFF